MRRRLPRNGFQKYPLARAGSGHLTPSALQADPPRKVANHCLRQPIKATADSGAGAEFEFDLMSSDCCPPYQTDNHGFELYIVLSLQC